MKAKHTLNHLSVNIKGALANYKNESMAGLFTDDDGNKMSDEKIRIQLHNEQCKGNKYIAGSSFCEGFDGKEGCCPGHEYQLEIEGIDLSEYCLGVVCLKHKNGKEIQFTAQVSGKSASNLFALHGQFIKIFEKKMNISSSKEIFMKKTSNTDNNYTSILYIK
jgi:hypothetical protein